MKTEIEKLAKEFAEGYEDATPMQLFLGCRAAIVQGIELALGQEPSETMRAVGNILESELTRKNSQSATEVFNAMRAVQIAEFTKEMKGEEMK